MAIQVIIHKRLLEKDVVYGNTLAVQVKTWRSCKWCVEGEGLAHGAFRNFILYYFFKFIKVYLIRIEISWGIQSWWQKKKSRILRKSQKPRFLFIFLSNRDTKNMKNSSNYLYVHFDWKYPRRYCVFSFSWVYEFFSDFWASCHSRPKFHYFAKFDFIGMKLENKTKQNKTKQKTKTKNSQTRKNERT